MKQSTLERRVEMIQNIREMSNNNEKTMNNIHSIMNNSTPVEEGQRTTSKLKYRALIALILFGIYALASVNNIEYMGVNSKDIETIITKNLDYQEVFEQMNIPLTDITGQK